MLCVRAQPDALHRALPGAAGTRRARARCSAPPCGSARPLTRTCLSSCSSLAVRRAFSDASSPRIAATCARPSPRSKGRDDARLKGQTDKQACVGEQPAPEAHVGRASNERDAILRILAAQPRPVRKAKIRQPPHQHRGHASCSLYCRAGLKGVRLACLRLKQTTLGHPQHAMRRQSTCLRSWQPTLRSLTVDGPRKPSAAHTPDI